MKIRWTMEAADNLEDIHQYLFLDHSPFTQSTVQQLYEDVYSLRTMPLRGRLGRLPNTRELVLTRIPYIIVYTVRLDIVEIVSIRHGARKPFR